MVFIQRVKKLDENNLICFEMDVDKEQHKIVLTDLKGTIFLLNVDDLVLYFDKWRLQFQTTKNYSQNSDPIKSHQIINTNNQEQFIDKDEIFFERVLFSTKKIQYQVIKQSQSTLVDSQIEISSKKSGKKIKLYQSTPGKASQNEQKEDFVLACQNKRDQICLFGGQNFDSLILKINCQNKMDRLIDFCFSTDSTQLLILWKLEGIVIFNINCHSRSYNSKEHIIPLQFTHESPSTLFSRHNYLVIAYQTRIIQIDLQDQFRQEKVIKEWGNKNQPKNSMVDNLQQNNQFSFNQTQNIIMNWNEQNNSIFEFSANKGLEQLNNKNLISFFPVRVTSSAFSQHSYFIPDNLDTLANKQQLQNLIRNLQSQPQILEKNIYEIIVFGVGSRFQLIAFNRYRIYRLLELCNLKYTALKIKWVSPYQFIFIDEDQSLYFVNLSPHQLGLSLG